VHDSPTEVGTLLGAIFVSEMLSATMTGALLLSVVAVVLATGSGQSLRSVPPQIMLDFVTESDYDVPWLPSSNRRQSQASSGSGIRPSKATFQRRPSTPAFVALSTGVLDRSKMPTLRNENDLCHSICQGDLAESEACIKCEKRQMSLKDGTLSAGFLQKPNE
jgi:hypothetical protein